MIQLDDLKVFSANAVCVIMLNIINMNAGLQSILLLATICYTVVRTINEIQKFKDKKNGKADSVKSDDPEEVQA